jgi:hypothetical protein
MYSQANATLAQFDDQQHIKCQNCSKARDTKITSVRISSIVVVSTMMVPPGVLLVPDTTAATPTKHIPTIEANPQIVVPFDS